MHKNRPIYSDDPHHNRPYWHRRFLPHFDQKECYQMITYRLADSLPKEAFLKIQKEEDKIKRRGMIEEYLDAGLGACFLKEDKIAQLIIDAWMHFHQERYDLIAYVVMPNHVHLLIKTYANHPLEKLVHSWKSWTAHEINKLRDDHLEHIWQREYWDRYIRHEEHFYQAIDYIHSNPVKAGLVENAEEWQWSSAKGLLRNK